MEGRFVKCKNMSNVKRLGEKIQKLRKERGLTLAQLANELGLSSHAYFSDIENGAKRPSLDLVVSLSVFFNVSTDQLLRDDLEV